MHNRRFTAQEVAVLQKELEKKTEVQQLENQRAELKYYAEQKAQVGVKKTATAAVEPEVKPEPNKTIWDEISAITPEQMQLLFHNLNSSPCDLNRSVQSIFNADKNTVSFRQGEVKQEFKHSGWKQVFYFDDTVVAASPWKLTIAAGTYAVTYKYSHEQIDWKIGFVPEQQSIVTISHWQLQLKENSLEEVIINIFDAKNGRLAFSEHLSTDSNRFDSFHFVYPNHVIFCESQWDKSKLVHYAWDYQIDYKAKRIQYVHQYDFVTQSPSWFQIWPGGNLWSYNLGNTYYVFARTAIGLVMYDPFTCDDFVDLVKAHAQPEITSPIATAVHNSLQFILPRGVCDIVNVYLNPNRYVIFNPTKKLPIGQANPLRNQLAEKIKTLTQKQGKEQNAAKKEHYGELLKVLTNFQDMLSDKKQSYSESIAALQKAHPNFFRKAALTSTKFFHILKQISKVEDSISIIDFINQFKEFDNRYDVIKRF